MTKKTKAKLLASLNAELTAAIDTKEAANLALHKEAFESAVENIRRIERTIRMIERPVVIDHSGRAELVAANID